MEILKNLMVGLLAGDLVLWSMVLIVVLFTWVVADAAILTLRKPKRTVLEQEKARMEHRRSLREDVIHSDWFGNRWHSICDD
jgi:hypothetical protein